MESAVRAAGAIGGTAAILSGLKKYSDAKVHTQALKELSDSFKSEVAPQVVDVEGRTLRLTGTAEEQYREWRKLLHELYLEENGTLTVADEAGPAAASADTSPAGAVPPPRSHPADGSSSGATAGASSSSPPMPARPAALDPAH